MANKSGWQLTGGGAEAYEKYIAEPILKPCTPGLVQAADIAAGDRAVDIACGTGIVTRLVAENVGHSGHVIGLDMNPGMLSIARELTKSQISDIISWIRSDATKLPVPDSAVDAVLCQQGLQFFPDKPAALNEINRVLIPEGRIAFSVLREIGYNPFHKAIADALEIFAGSDVARVIYSPFTMYDTEELRKLFETSGFKKVHINHEIITIRFGPVEELVPGYLAATPVAAEIELLDDKIKFDILSHVKGLLEPYIDDDGLAAPLEYFVVTGKK